MTFAESLAAYLGVGLVVGLFALAWWFSVVRKVVRTVHREAPSHNWAEMVRVMRLSLIHEEVDASGQVFVVNFRLEPHQAEVSVAWNNAAREPMRLLVNRFAPADERLRLLAQIDAPHTLTEEQREAIRRKLAGKKFGKKKRRRGLPKGLEGIS